MVLSDFFGDKKLTITSNDDEKNEKLMKCVLENFTGDPGEGNIILFCSFLTDIK